MTDSAGYPAARRSPRVDLSIPVALRWEGERFGGSTLSVNTHGGRLYAQRNVAVGDIFELENVRTRVLCHCRVLWQGGLDHTGFFKLGVEMLEAHPSVWGSDYAAALARSQGSSG